MSSARSGSVEPKLAGLVRQRVSQINGCAFCLDMHAHELREAGETNDRIDLLPAWDEVDVYSEREKATVVGRADDLDPRDGLEPRALQPPRNI